MSSYADFVNALVALANDQFIDTQDEIFTVRTRADADQAELLRTAEIVFESLRIARNSANAAPTNSCMPNYCPSKAHPTE